MINKARYCWVFCFILMATTVFAQLPTLDLPPRPTNAPVGSAFKTQIENLPLTEREAAIEQQVLAGNVPDFLRALYPVTIRAQVSGSWYAATFYVIPDYLAVGTDEDYFRIPTTPLLAQRIADATSAILPTRKMSDAIWVAAPCKLTPSPIPPSPQMITVPVYWNHELTLRSQRAAKPDPLGTLVAGHKKDVVISPRLHDSSTPKRVAIYGWHQVNGAAIQPLYLGHGETYADYSHGIRLVNNEMLLNGAPTTVADVLTSTVALILNDEATQFTQQSPPRYGVLTSDINSFDAY